MFCTTKKRNGIHLPSLQSFNQVNLGFNCVCMSLDEEYRSVVSHFASVEILRRRPLVVQDCCRALENCHIYTTAHY